MLAVIAAVALGLTSASASAHPATPDPTSGLAGLFRGDDYPAEALQKNEQGQVGVSIHVDAAGSVSDCIIKSSSKSTILDKRTCDVIRERAKFKPALDRRGRPVATQYHRTISWRTMDERMPSDAWASSEVIDYGPYGDVVSCHFDLEGALKPKPGTSSPACPQSDLKEMGPANGPGGAVDRIVVEERFTPGPQASPQLGANQMIAGREVFHLDIDATGKLVSCKLADRIGSPAKIDLCTRVEHQYAVRKGADGKAAPFSAVEAFTKIVHVDPAAPPQPDPLNGSLQGLFTSDDYPANALDRDDQGQVGIVIRTDPKGAISDCVVEETSKSEDLDKQTCDVIRKRAKFKPALNKQGRAVTGEYRARIHWQIEDEITPSDPWAVRTVVNFTPDGRPLSCHMEFDGARALQPGTGPASCDAEAELGAPPKVADLPGAIGTVVMEQRFQIGRVQATPVAPGDFLVGRQVLSLDVDADGKLTSCKVVAIAGPDPGSDPCSQVEKQYSLHKGRDEKPAPFNATEIFTIYVRVEKIALGSISPFGH